MQFYPLIVNGEPQGQKWYAAFGKPAKEAFKSGDGKFTFREVD
jgi:hypothetical protein